MRIKKIIIYFLVLVMMMTSLPVNMFTVAAQEVCLVDEVDEVQTVEGQKEPEEDLSEDCMMEEVIEFEETEAGALESAEQELETETEVYPEIMIEEVAEVEGYDASVIASGSCGEDVTWELDASLNLAISGEGAMKDYKDSDETDRAPWLNYLDTNFTLNSVTVEPGITRIGANAFGWCWINSTSMQLPDTLVEIGESAFRGCNNLSQIIIPDGVTKIEDYAFAGTDLVTMVLPDSVISIGKRVLGECFILESVELPEGMTELPEEMFISCWELKNIEIPSGVTKIGGNAFAGCKSITELTLPDGLTTIGNGSFGNCAGLRNLCIPASVTRIGDRAFFYITRFNGVDYGKIEIQFMGDMPVFEGAEVFTGAQGTLCYLSGASDTWTADLSSYGLDANIMSVCSFGSGNCGSNVTWSFGVDGVLTISGTGAMADYDSYSDQPWRDYADDINEVVINDGVTAVGDNGFTSLLNLKKVRFPDTLERIGCQAFWGCEKLDNVVLPESLKRLEEDVFYYCESLSELVIPEGVAGKDGYLGGCLGECTALTSVVLPENLTVVPDYMFYNCIALEHVNLPDTVTTIGEYAFCFCMNLEEVVIPSGVNTIERFAFYACEGLKRIQFSEGIVCLEAYVLGRCGNLTAFTIPESVNTIGEGAFAASGLQNITIPEAVTEIRAAAFWQCKNLTEVTFEGALPVFTSQQTDEASFKDTIYPFQDLTLDCYYLLGGAGWSRTQPADCGGTLTMIPYGVVSGYLERDGEAYAQWRLRADGEFVLSGTGDMQDFGSEDDYDAEDRPWYKYKDLIKRVTIGNSITSIGSKAFYGCENLTEVSLSDAITRIGESAFEQSGIISIVIPASVKEIEAYAFMTCENLLTIDLRNGIEIIGECAFMECVSLSSIIIPASVKTIGASAFRYSGLEAVLFVGDLPQIGANAFSTYPSFDNGIRVEYPDDNETWAGLTLESLGGSTEGGVFVFGEHVHVWGTGVQTTAPTCTAAGVKTYTCGICGKTKTEAIGAKGHSWNGGVQTTAPTCTAAGVKTYTCGNCGGTKKESMNSLGHNAGSWTITKAATCTVEGAKEKKCTRCKTVLNTEKIGAKGHSWGSWKVGAAATVFAAQQEERTCSVCKLTEKKSTGSKLKAQMKLNYNNIPLRVGQSTTKIEVSGLAAGDSVKSWKSNKTKIATVNSKGKITGKKAGTAKITVTLASGLSETITVKVQKGAVKTTAIWIVGYTDFTLQKGKKFDLAASMKPYVTPVTSLEKITYSSSNEKILKVNSKGVVTAVGAGKAKIIIKSGKIKDYATFTVPKVKTTSMSNVPEKISLKRLKKYTIKAKLNPTNSDEKITYKSSNKKVATVTDKGVIKTWVKGTAKITVTSGSVKKVINVTVKK